MTSAGFKIGPAAMLGVRCSCCEMMIDAEPIASSRVAAVEQYPRVLICELLWGREHVILLGVSRWVKSG
jgi:hypothetical protein